MAVAREMETAVIVRETPQGDQLRTAVVEREIAQAMALKEWITCPDATGRIARCFVTNAGCAALRRLTARVGIRRYACSDGTRGCVGHQCD